MADALQLRLQQVEEAEAFTSRTSSEEEALYLQRMSLKAQIKGLEEQLKDVESVIREGLEEGLVYGSDSTYLRIDESVRNGLDAKKIQALVDLGELPGHIIDRCRTQTVVKTLREVKK